MISPYCGPEPEVADAQVVDRRLGETDAEARRERGPWRPEPDDQGRDETLQPEQAPGVDRERRGGRSHDRGERRERSDEPERECNEPFDREADEPRALDVGGDRLQRPAVSGPLERPGCEGGQRARPGR